MPMYVPITYPNVPTSMEGPTSCNPALGNGHTGRCGGSADVGVGRQHDIFQVKSGTLLPPRKQKAMFLTTTTMKQNTNNSGALCRISEWKPVPLMAKKNI